MEAMKVAKNESFIKRLLKQLLVPIIREVIEEREKEITDTIRQAVAHRHRIAL